MAGFEPSTARWVADAGWALGGDGIKRLFVTATSFSIARVDLADQPFAGEHLVIEPGDAGFQAPYYAG